MILRQGLFQITVGKSNEAIRRLDQRLSRWRIAINPLNRLFIAGTHRSIGPGPRRLPWVECVIEDEALENFCDLSLIGRAFFDLGLNAQIEILKVGKMGSRFG